MAKGFIYINVYADNIAIPLERATVTITGEETNITLTTNKEGKTPLTSLETVDIKYTEEFQTTTRPYSVYTITVSKEGFNTKVINGVQIFDSQTSIQNIFLDSKTQKAKMIQEENISDITLWSNTSPSNNTISNQVSKDAKVLQEIVIPEYIIVHDGIPTNTSAPNYTVTFPDYIKNVACSEIYSTWPKETLKANILCIISFTLNRVYTEWYKSKGYSFTITSSPIYDQKYSHNRTIFLSISEIVDEIFTSFIRRANKQEPLLALYNDGKTTNNPGWFSQWGSKELGDKGLDALSIIKTYYGNDISIYTADKVSGLPSSYPGMILELNSCGEYVQKIQNELNYIRGSYPLIPLITNPNGVFDDNTKSSLEIFQRIFNLPITGKIDYATWYKISYIFVAVSKMIQGINI